MLWPFNLSITKLVINGRERAVTNTLLYYQPRRSSKHFMMLHLTLAISLTMYNVRKEAFLKFLHLRNVISPHFFWKLFSLLYVISLQSYRYASNGLDRAIKCKKNALLSFHRRWNAYLSLPLLRLHIVRYFIIMISKYT